jgi:hypothetical protein
MRTWSALATASILASAVAGCSERPQALSGKPGANYSGKPDTPAYKAQSTAYSAGNFQSGDRAGWEKAIKARTDGQNEYARVR